MMESLEDYREDRISKITACETPVPLTEGPKVVLHLIPFPLPETPTSVDLTSIEPAHEGLFLLGGTERAENRFNFDGRAVADFPEEGKTTAAYLQLFKTGTLESVYPLFSEDHPEEENRKMIPGWSVETRLIKSIIPYLGLISFLELAFPVTSMISLTGVQGWGVLPNTHNRVWSNFRHLIDRDILPLPPIVFKSLPESTDEVASALKPAFDVMWNAAGWEGSRNYGASGYVWE